MRAVVFDCDGVLVDSEPLSERAWAEVLGGHGYQPTDGDHAATRGTTGRDTEAYYRRHLDLAGDHDLLAEVDALRRQWFDKELAVFDDAVVTVRALAAEGLPLAVASSSGRVELDIKLAKFDLTRYFDATVAGDEVVRGKPAPDLYEEAARALGVPPAGCLAVDDTEIGADAAAAAGMRAVQILRDGSLSLRYPVVSSLDPELILHWLGLR